MTKPLIVVSFEDNPLKPGNTSCTWLSAGWADNKVLMAVARAAIAKGDTPEQVIQLLEQQGFRVANNTPPCA